MSKQQLTILYGWGIKILVFVIPFLSIWIAKSMFFPYITGRNFGFRILVELALVLWVGLVFLDKKFLPRRNWIFWAVIAFVAVVGIADFFGVNAYKSFWSNYERMEGFLTISHMAVYFLILTSVFRSKREWMTYFNLFVFAGFLVGVYGIFQKLGLREAIQGGENRIDGTIGNPTYLAAYLTLIIALTSVLFFNAKKYWLKILYALLIAFDFLIIYFSATRGAALSFMVAIPLFLFFYFWFFKNDEREILHRKIAMWVLIAMAVSTVGFILVKNQPFVQDNAVLSRFANISFGEKTVRSRFMIWGISWQGFLERPILGWGQENYLQVFAKYYNPGLYDQEPWFDRSHDIIFDWLINAGILGLLAYLSMFVALFYAILRTLKTKFIDAKECLILLVIPIAYFIQNIFVFDNYNTYVLFFTILAYVGSQYANSGEEKETEQRDASADVFRSTIAVISALIIGGSMIYFWNIRPIAQSQGIINSLMATTDAQDPVGATLKSFQDTLSYNTFGNSEVLEQLGRVSSLLVNQSNISPQSKAQFIAFAVAELEKSLAKFPNDIRGHLFAGDVYQGAQSLNAGYFFKAREHFKRAVELGPNKQQVLFSLANNYLYTQEYDKAMELAQKAVDVEPANFDAHGNKGIIAILMGRDDIVQVEINEMDKWMQLEKEPGKFGSYLQQLQKIARTYANVQQYAKARSVFIKLTMLAPDNKDYKKELESIQGK